MTLASRFDFLVNLVFPWTLLHFETVLHTLIFPIRRTDIDVRIAQTNAYFMLSDVVERQTLARIGNSRHDLQSIGSKLLI